MKKSYKLENLCCANCAARIEDRINRLEAVQKATLNFMTLRLTIESETEHWDAMMEDVLKIFRKVEPGCRVIVK